MPIKASQLFVLVSADTDEAERKLREMGATVSRTAGQSRDALGSFDQALGGLGASVGQFAGPAGIGLLVAGVAKGAWALNQMREESAQLEARFVGFTGSLTNADAAMRAYDTTLGNAMSKDEKMAAASQLLGLGIAKNAQEAATLTQQALILGMSVEELSQTLETGRANGLVRYGISVTEVARRTEELQKNNENLSEAEAKRIAIMEQVAEASRRVAEAGGRAATPTAELAKSVDTLKDNLADLIDLTGGINGVTTAITGLSRNFELGNAGAVAADATSSIEARMLAAQKQIDDYQAQREKWAGGDRSINMLGFNDQYAADEISRLEGVKRSLELYGGAADEVRGKLDTYLEAARTAGQAQEALNSAVSGGHAGQIAQAQAILDAANAERDQALAAYQASEATAQAGVNANASAAFFLKLGDHAKYAAEQMRAATMLDMEAHPLRVQQYLQGNASNARWEGMGAYYGRVAEAEAADARAGRAADALRWQGQADLKTELDRKTAEANARLVQGANERIATDWESAMKEATGRIVDKFNEGSKFSSGLEDMTGGNPLAPGKNGPFEDIYRLQAWVKGGTWGETAAKHGFEEGDKAAVAGMIGDFQRGNYTADVLKLVNIPQLQDIMQGEKNAASSQDQLAKLLGVDPGQLAKFTGRDTAGIGAVLDPKQGADLAQALKGSGQNVNLDFKGGLADAILKAIDADLVLRSVELGDKGGLAWDKLETGMLNRASKSSRFAAMIDAMVDNALANYIPSD